MNELSVAQFPLTDSRTQSNNNRLSPTELSDAQQRQRLANQSGESQQTTSQSLATDSVRVSSTAGGSSSKGNMQEDEALRLYRQIASMM